VQWKKQRALPVQMSHLKEEKPMRSGILFIVVSLLCFVPTFDAEAQQQKKQTSRRPRASQPAPKAPQSPKVSKLEPVKVLVHRLETGLVAADGYLYIWNLPKPAVKNKPEVAESVQLISGGPIEAEEESKMRVQVMTMGAPEPAEWEKNLAGYDFLISWTLDYHERTKYSLGDKLQIDVKETWKVEKASAAAEQYEKVVAPARGPILKEIRAFMLSQHRAKMD
jgi:hypothetical protein